MNLTLNDQPISPSDLPALLAPHITVTDRPLLQRWTDALTSGRYHHATGTMVINLDPSGDNPRIGNCCLGVLACEVSSLTPDTLLTIADREVPSSWDDDDENVLVANPETNDYDEFMESLATQHTFPATPFPLIRDSRFPKIRNDNPPHDMFQPTEPVDVVLAAINDRIPDPWPTVIIPLFKLLLTRP
jgi:hypothetical protein